MFYTLAEGLARGMVPQPIADATRLGKKLGVRGVVTRDVVRRLVARKMAQELSEAVESVTVPFHPTRLFQPVQGANALHMHCKD